MEQKSANAPIKSSYVHPKRTEQSSERTLARTSAHSEGDEQKKCTGVVYAAIVSEYKYS